MEDTGIHITEKASSYFSTKWNSRDSDFQIHHHAIGRRQRFYPSSTEVAFGPTSSSLPHKGWAQSHSLPIQQHPLIITHTPDTWRITDGKSQIWRYPLHTSRTSAGPHDRREPRITWVGVTIGAIPSKSPIKGRTGPAEEHSFSALRPNSWPKARHTPDWKSHQWRPQQLAATCLFGLEQEIHFSTIYTADLRNKLITAAAISHTVQLIYVACWESLREVPDGCGVQEKLWPRGPLLPCPAP